MQLTTEQLAIIEASQTGINMIVTARAGAAKTTTLVEIAKANPGKSTLSLAFNKSIAEEMKARLPDNCTAMTINACGFKAWRNFTGARLRVEPKKLYNLIKAEIDATDDQELKSFLWENYGEIRDACSAAKTSGVLFNQKKGYRPLMSGEDFFLYYPVDLEPELRYCVEKVCNKSFELAITTEVDFDDMLLGPAVAPVSFDYFDLILVDEAQDLSHINHVLIKKMKRQKTQLIAVGDPCQAIYAFRGADTQSMDRLRDMFSMQEFFLTTSFRCPQKIIENVWWRAADMVWPSWAKEGEVRRPSTLALTQIPDGAAIICRNNAPLFSLAIRLLRNKRRAVVKGRDTVAKLVKVMKKFGKASMSSIEAIASLNEWEEKERKRQKIEGVSQDMADCIRLFLEETKTLGDAIAFAEHLAQQEGRIYLYTGHGSKGLEFDHVIFLDHHLLNRKKGQDANVDYVIATRAKETLTYIDSSSITDEVELEYGDPQAGDDHITAHKPH